MAPRLLLRVLARWQVTHGGLDLEDMRHHPDFFRSHDRAARTDYFNLGAGAAFSLGSSWDVYAIFIKTLSGENAHQSRSLSFGATYYFGGGFGGGTRRALEALEQPEVAAQPVDRGEQAPPVRRQAQAAQGDAARRRGAEVPRDRPRPARRHVYRDQLEPKVAR